MATECEHSKETCIHVIDDMISVSCTRCGQVRAYKRDDVHSTVIKKLGRIDGAVVMPPAGVRLENLTPEEHRAVSEGWERLQNVQEETEFKKKLDRLREIPDAKVKPEPENKGVIMSDNEERAIPPKPANRKRLWSYYEQHKEAIIADYYSMRLAWFLSRWQMTSTTWQKLKPKWGVKNKGKGSGQKGVSKKAVKTPLEATEEQKNYKLMYETYRQAVLDIFGCKGQNEVGGGGDDDRR